MGRKSKPVALHLVEGTYNQTRHGAQATEADGNEATPPYKLNKQQQALWDQLTRDLWWNTRAESELLMMYICLTLDRRNFERGRAHKNNWSPALMSRYQAIGAELGIGYTQRQRAPKKGSDDQETLDFD